VEYVELVEYFVTSMVLQVEYTKRRRFGPVVQEVL